MTGFLSLKYAVSVRCGSRGSSLYIFANTNAHMLPIPSRIEKHEFCDYFYWQSLVLISSCPLRNQETMPLSRRPLHSGEKRRIFADKLCHRRSHCIHKLKFKNLKSRLA